MTSNENEYTSCTDEELIIYLQMFKADGESAEIDKVFTIFCNRYASYIYVICFNNIGECSNRKKRAEELANAIFYKIYSNVEKYRTKQSVSKNPVKAWIGRIASNFITDSLRKGGNPKMKILDDSKEDDFWDKQISDLNKTQEFFPTSEKEALLRALDSIKNDEHKKILIEYYRRKPVNGTHLDNGQIQEIADIFDTTTSNIKKITQRLFAKVKSSALQQIKKS